MIKKQENLKTSKPTIHTLETTLVMGFPIPKPMNAVNEYLVRVGEQNMYGLLSEVDSTIESAIQSSTSNDLHVTCVTVDAGEMYVELVANVNFTAHEMGLALREVESVIHDITRTLWNTRFKRMKEVKAAVDEYRKSL